MSPEDAQRDLAQVYQAIEAATQYHEHRDIAKAAERMSETIEPSALSRALQDAGQQVSEVISALHDGELVARD